MVVRLPGLPLEVTSELSRLLIGPAPSIASATTGLSSPNPLSDNPEFREGEGIKIVGCIVRWSTAVADTASVLWAAGADISGEVWPMIWLDGRY